MARPRKQVDVNLLEGLAAIGCSDVEISRLAGCSVDTLHRHFADIIDKGRVSLRMKLRRWQLRAAERGSTAMLIFLGKNLLGQRDTVQLDVNRLDSDIEVELGRLAQLASGSESTPAGETESETVN